MKTLMYPIAPDDDFPEMFCAIRPYDGEHQFYKSEGERTNALLSRMHKEAMKREEAIDSLTDRNQRLRVNNAMLRELVRDMWEGYNDPRCEECHLKDTQTCADCPICAREASVVDRMRDLGVEVD